MARLQIVILEQQILNIKKPANCPKMNQLKKPVFCYIVRTFQVTLFVFLRLVSGLSGRKGEASSGCSGGLEATSQAGVSSLLRGSGVGGGEEALKPAPTRRRAPPEGLTASVTIETQSSLSPIIQSVIFAAKNVCHIWISLITLLSCLRCPPWRSWLVR